MLRVELNGLAKMPTLSCFYYTAWLQQVKRRLERYIMPLHPTPSMTLHHPVHVRISFTRSPSIHPIVQILYIQSGEVCHHVRRRTNSRRSSVSIRNPKQKITHIRMGVIVRHEREMVYQKTFWAPEDAECAGSPIGECNEKL
jgi:hypothetical protein